MGNDGGFNGSAGGTFTAVTGLANSIISGGDLANPGSWGVGPAVNAAGTPVGVGTATPFTLFPETTATNNGTSADMSVVHGFNVATDTLDFSVGAWSRAGFGNGLMSGNLTFAAANFTNPGSSGLPVLVSAGQNVPASAHVVELNGTFTDANAVALALGTNTGSGGGTYNLVFAGGDI